ncbi:hypothetical protein [Sphingobacterium multivorum]|uniref:hypothetical protein n=1 Tax=Sphingobacterium multivorum TaxID=28454 RepID=UPI0028A66E5E|nr:hypothetical protein [Sphingobacterium multivorum]
MYPQKRTCPEIDLPAGLIHIREGKMSQLHFSTSNPNSMLKKHGSLFTGIGGFDLAASWMGWENIFSCEKNPYSFR